MSRKPQRGYYVRGHFVAEGSELDLELKRQGKWDAEFSKTDRKRQSEELQTLGKQLLDLRDDLYKGLDLPDALHEALEATKRIRDFEGRRRQLQYVGKLMRKLDAEEVEAIRAALQVQESGHAADVGQLHKAETWRTQLLDEAQGEQALTQWIAQYPQTDVQQLRSLIRQARKDMRQKQQAQQAAHVDAGQAPRQSRSYRELFQLIKQALQGGDADEMAQDEE